MKGEGFLEGFPGLCVYDPALNPRGPIKEFHLVIASTLLLSLAFSLPQGDVLPPGFRLVRTPDGSRFFLHKTEGRPLAIWTYVSRMGREQENFQLEGLSAACLQASVQAKKMRALLAKTPAVQLRLRTGTQTSTLQAFLPSDRILSFANLMKERRTSPSFDGFSRFFEEAHEALKQKFQNRADLTPFRKMALATVLRDPVRVVLFPPSEQAAQISEQEARRFFLQNNLPSQGLTLIEGNFDLALVARGLSHIFTTPSKLRPPLALAEEPQPTSSRVLRAHHPGKALASIAWRIPSRWNQAELEVLALAFQNTEVKGSEALIFRAIPSFPSLGRPGIFALEAKGLAAGQDSQELLQHLQKRIAALLSKDGSGTEILQKATRIWRARQHAGFERPEAKLEKLARTLLLGTYGTLPDKPATLLNKAKGLLQNQGQCISLVDPILSPKNKKDKEGGK